MKHRFRVNVGRRNRYFASLEEAQQFCSAEFARSGVVLSIAMKTPAAIPGCKSCGKKLGAKFARCCKDCGHDLYWHRMTPSSAQTTCRGGKDCSCTAIQPQTLGERTSEQFPRVRMGFGIDAHGLFCTVGCAVSWAHKHAGGKR